MAEQIIKLSGLTKEIGISGSSIYRAVTNGTFPKPIKLGERSSGWLRSEVDEWLQKRIEASRNSEVA